MNHTGLIRLTGLLGASSVAIGAFGAHGLENLVDASQLTTFETGVRYQFYHSFAIGLGALLYPSSRVHRQRVKTCVLLWLAGIVLFSGSLYLLSLTDYHGLPAELLGPITPIGGLFLIAGWICVLFTPKPPQHKVT